MIDPQDLASALKQLRGQRTQRYFADKAGIDPGSWSAYEKGIRVPRSFQRLERMAAALGVDVAALLDIVAREQRRRRLSASPVPPEAAGPMHQAQRLELDFEVLERELDGYLESTKKMILFLLRWLQGA